MASARAAGPAGSAGDHDLLDAHVLDAFPEVLTVDRIPIPDQEPWRLILRERFDDLPSRLLGCRMRCDVENAANAYLTTSTKYSGGTTTRCRGRILSPGPRDVWARA